MSALVPIFGVVDGTNIIITCLQDKSRELLLIHIRERQVGDVAINAGGLVYLLQEKGDWRTETGRAASIHVFDIKVDIVVSAGAGIWCW